MSSSPNPDIFDLALIGGGYSSLAVIANLAKLGYAGKICVIADEGFETFGPAYATPHDEHLLNVRARSMSLYADAPDHFYQHIACDPESYVPRKVYGQYLAHIARETCRQLHPAIIKDVATSVDRTGDTFKIGYDKNHILTRRVVIAAGNRLLCQGSVKHLVENAWQFDYSQLNGKTEDVLIIGSGLTALDTILSLHKADFRGKITCISGNGHLPLAHPHPFHQAKIPVVDATPFKNLRLSGLMRQLRAHAKTVDWPYAIDSLRAHTADIWRSLTPEDQKRFLRKYLWLWNMHRHRYAPHLKNLIDMLKTEGRLVLRRGKVGNIRNAGDNAVAVDVRSPYAEITGEVYAKAFKCIGPSYRLADQPLLSSLVEKNLATAHPNGYGITVDGDFKASQNIWALGPPLLGMLLETIAVPDLRHQAAQVARSIIPS